MSKEKRDASRRAIGSHARQPTISQLREQGVNVILA
jgi:hypothetical protein